jgi:hypothetical protein
MMKQLLNKLPFLLLIFVVGSVLISNLLWIELNQLSPYFDTSGHTILTYIFARIFGGDYEFNGIRALLTQSNYYPPLTYFFGSVITLLFGFDYKVLQNFSSILLIPTATILYLYTKKITQNSLWAVFTTSLFVLFPVIWEQARYYMLDLPLTMWILASIYSLEKSDLFKKPLPTILFFIFAGFAQLTKWYGFVYLILPFMFTFYEASKQHQNKRDLFFTLGKFSMVALAIALPWYLVNFSVLIKDIIFFSHAHYQNPTATFSLQNILYYPTLMLNFQIVSIMFLWLIVSLFMFIFGKSKFKKFMLLQIGVSLLVFTLLGNKNVRFTMPLLPFLSIIMGYGLMKLKEHAKSLAYAIWVALVSFGLLFMTINSFGIPFKINKMHFLSLVPNWDIFILLDGTSNIIPYHYQDTEWSAKSVLDTISNRASETSPNVLVGINSQYLSQPVIEVFKFQENSPVTFATPPFDSREPLNTSDKIQTYLKPFDYLIIPKVSVGPKHHVNYSNLETIREYVLSGKIRTYKWVTTYNLPDGEEVYLFELDKDYNRLQIDVVDNALFIQRPDAPTQIFIQMADNNNKWYEYNLGIHQTNYYQPLTNIKTIRIDYPPELWQLYHDLDWKYDFDKQIDNSASSAPVVQAE